MQMHSRFVLVLLKFSLTRSYGDGANQGAKDGNRAPNEQGHLPTAVFGYCGNAKGGNSASHVGAGIKHTRYGGDIAILLKVGWHHCGEH